jgi:AraC family transcriptional activator of mtrCDE
MHWSLSEFLNLIELRGQSWCFVDMAPRSGFHVTHGEAIFFHAMLEGSAKITIGTGETIELNPGDVAMVISGDAHTLRNHPDSPTEAIDLLTKGDYVDTPPTIHLGQGYAATRLVSGRLKVRWPGGSYPNRIPAILITRSSESGVEVGKFTATANEPGAAALLTHLATLLFVGAFRQHPRCTALFRWNLDDPIARAQVFIERHPFQPWTVEALGKKVGMGRSNFAARFTAQIGKTPIDVLTEERMKHAEKFLQTTELKIGEVSERVGYRSEAAFIRRFTDHFGMPPGKFRRQARLAGAPEQDPPSQASIPSRNSSKRGMKQPSPSARTDVTIVPRKPRLTKLSGQAVSSTPRP